MGVGQRLIAGGAVLRAYPQDVMEACYKAANEEAAEVMDYAYVQKRALPSDRFPSVVYLTLELE